MNRMDVGQTIGILANVGVIAGIVFLGIELRQNNELLAFDKSRSQLEVYLTRIDNALENPGLLESVYRHTEGSEPSQEQMDEVRYQLSVYKLIATYEWQFLQSPDRRSRLRSDIQSVFGSLPEESWRDFWARGRMVLDSEFVPFFEDAAGIM